MVQKYSYNWLCDYLGENAPTPEVIADLLTAHAFEVEGIDEHDSDTIFELKILPDRGSDCLSHRGIAREIATLTGVPLAVDPLHIPVTISATDLIQVQIADVTLSPRFTASLIRGVKVDESPEWLKTRLAAIGTRSINNIVDATNYVMYAMGQPLHAYDAVKFPQVNGVWQFVVRPAEAGETVSLLAEGGKDEDRIVTLRGGELLIVDGSANVPIGLAGVKGGRFAGVTTETTDIIIEAAHFDAGLTRRTARGLGIVIDASKRFENEPARALPPLSQQMITDLIIKIAGGTTLGMIDVYPVPKVPPVVSVEVRAVNARLGIELSTEVMVDILTRVGVTVEMMGDTLSCTGPLERTDLNIPEDFIEEIGRVYGYQHVVSVVPETVPLSEYNVRHVYSEQIRAVLVAAGFTEIITTSFRNQDEIGLQSSLASDKCFLRSELSSGLGDALSKNAPFTDLLGVADTKLFEIGTVFTRESGTVAEHVSLVVGVRLRTTGYSGKEDASLTLVCNLLEAELGIPFDWVLKAGVAECSVSTLLATLPVPTAYAVVPKAKETIYKAFSVYPSVSRDIALWVQEGTEVSAVEEIIRFAAGPLMVRLTHLDTFTKDGRTSLAFRLVFQSSDRTLVDFEVNGFMESINSIVAEKGWIVR